MKEKLTFQKSSVDDKVEKLEDKSKEPFGTFLETYKTPAEVEVVDLEVKAADLKCESAFFETGSKIIESLEPGSTVLFDYDGTQIGNIEQANHYIRRGFSELYGISKEKQLRVGTCSMRLKEDLQVTKGHNMDLLIGKEDIDDFLRDSKLSETQNIFYKEYQELEDQELLDQGMQVVDQYRQDQVVTDKLLAVLYLIKDKMLEYGDCNFSKILFLVELSVKYLDEKIVLIDDNAAVGRVGERLGIVAQAPLPENFVPDFNVS